MVLLEMVVETIVELETCQPQFKASVQLRLDALLDLTNAGTSPILKADRNGMEMNGDGTHD
jgi:hypothetical protein